MKKVITRFPPSPTGNLHMGSARTALFNFLFARHHKGKMLLRMEDTDKERSKKEFEENILEGLDWLGIEHEGEILRQSERTEIYKNYLQELIDKARLLANRARSLQIDVEMPNLSSYERFIIHAALADEKDIETESYGVGKDRRLVIKYINSN